MDREGKELASFPVTNDLPGARKLVEKLVSLSSLYRTTTLKIGMEATNMYWWHLSQFLVQNKTLKPYMLKVFVLNPKLVKKFHDSIDDWDKTDPIDALVIAEKVRSGKVKPSYLVDEKYEPLKRLTRFRCHLVRALVAEKNYFLSYLFLKYSSWQKIQPFSSPFGVSAQEIIAELDSEEIVNLSLADLAETVAVSSHHRLADPEKTALLIKEVANTSYQLNKVVKDSVDVILANTYDNIRFFENKIKEINGIIEKEFKRYSNPLTSIPGIGLVFAAGITGELGSTDNFTKQSAIGKYAGLCWKKSQSGEFEAEETPRRPGNVYLRYYLVAAANSLRVHNEEYRIYYERKYTEVPKHKHKRALVLTARKLARLCFAMLRDQRLYQPEQRKETA